MSALTISVPAKQAVKAGWVLFWLGLSAAVRRQTVTYSLVDEYTDRRDARGRFLPLDRSK